MSDQNNVSDEGGDLERVDWIPDDEWTTIVRNVPIVSVDLIVLTDEGVILAKRTNDPAKGEWFVPGGRVRKGERLEEAVLRVGREELGVEVEIVESIGVYEHLYDTADTPRSGGKHYVANGFVVRVGADQFALDGQHGAVRNFADLPADLHPYVENYLRVVSDSGYLDQYEAENR